MFLKQSKRGWSLAAVLVPLAVVLLIAGCSRSGSSTLSADAIPVTTSSDEARELFLQARELQEKVKLTASFPLLQKAVELDPDFAYAHMLMSLGQPTTKGFFESLEKAVNTAHNASDGEQKLIYAFEAGINGAPVKQERLLKELVALYPAAVRSHGNLGNFYFGQQRYGEAISEYQRAQEIDENFSQIYNQLGYSYRFLGRFDDAERAFKKYVELIPDDPNPYDSYAELLMKMGRYEESNEQYRKALEQDPNFNNSYIGIATNLNYLGRHDEARSYLSKRLESTPVVGEKRVALFAMAVSYADEGNLAQAVKMIEREREIADQQHDMAAASADVNLMGNLYYEMGEYDKAAERFEESVELFAQAPNVNESQIANNKLNHHYDMGRVEARRGNLEAAREHYDQYLAGANQNQNQFQQWAANQLGAIIALQEKNWDKAITQLNASNLQNPYNVYLLALAQQGKGNGEKAKEYFERAYNNNALNNIQQSFARMYAHKSLAAL